MNECEYYADGKCIVATHLADDIDCYVNEQACLACSKLANPYNENMVTAGIAAGHLYRAKKKLPKEVMQLLNVTINTLVDEAPTNGPGTELSKLIKWFYVESDPCMVCEYRIRKMNIWGPDECEKRIHQIVGWLRQAAVKRNIPFSDTVGYIIVRKAISKSRKQNFLVALYHKIFSYFTVFINAKQNIQ